MRRAGEAAVEQHLEAQVGRTHRVLMETPHVGRTEQFTEVSFTAAQAEGQIVEAVIRGVSESQLLAG